MKKHVARTRNEGCLDDVGGFGGCFGLSIAGMEEPVLVSGTDGCGPIIAQKAVKIHEDDTPETLQKRIMEEAEWKLLPEAVSLFCQGRLSVEVRKVRIK